MLRPILMSRIVLRLQVLLLVFGLLSVLAKIGQAAVLFADSFDRATTQVDDIDATTAGIVATFPLPADVYIERDQFLAGPLGGGPLPQADADALTNLEDNQLYLADGPNASALHINHNFVGSEVIALTASVDIAGNAGTADNTAQRWVGIGFGASEAEASAAVYDFNATDADGSRGWRGHVNNLDEPVAGSGFADLFVAWERVGGTDDNLGRIGLYNNGSRLALFDNAGALFEEGGTLEVNLTFANFDAGTPVAANVSYAGTTVGATAFNWDHTDSNYVGITARQNGSGWVIDNVRIEATNVPEPTSVALIALCGCMASAMAGRRKWRD